MAFSDPTSRTYLDALAGQPISESAHSALEILLSSSFASVQGRHSEGAAAREILQVSLQTLSALWQVPAQTIHPVAGLPAAFRLALSAIAPSATVALNPLSRSGLIDLVSPFQPQLLPVTDVGHVNHQTDAHFIVTQSGNQEVGTISTVDGNTATVITDASEYVGRLAGLPDGGIVIARADAWAGISNTCFVIDRHNKLNASPRMKNSSMPSVVNIAASVAALESLNSAIELHHRQLVSQLRDDLSSSCEVLGDPVFTLPHVMSLIAPGIDGEALALELDRRGIAVGSGSACLVETTSSSHVLAAMGKPDANHIRISLPVSVKNLDGVAEKILQAIAQLKK
jgi:cysteine desulfurase